jgi:DnaJ-class molecular chaperone
MGETVRCPGCRGAKKVAKLGGIIGSCNTCKGLGTILASDKVKVVVNDVVDDNKDIIDAVNHALPVSDSEPFKGVAIIDEPVVNEIDKAVMKENIKNVLYKRKTSNK